jgi:hypothetical protein
MITPLVLARAVGHALGCTQNARGRLEPAGLVLWELAGRLPLENS